MVLAKSKTSVAKSNKDARDKIKDFEKVLASQKDAVFNDSDLCPVKHSFSEGMYVREIFIPQGTVLTGKIHKHKHPNFLMKGSVEVFTEFQGMERLNAPVSMISEAGTKRVVKALTDVIWVTVHENKSNTKDLRKLESLIIAEDYKDYDNYIESKGNIFKQIQYKCRKFLK